LLLLAPHEPEPLQVGPDWVLPEQLTVPQAVPAGFGVGVGQVLEEPEQAAAFVQLVAARHCVPDLYEHTPPEAAEHCSHAPVQALLQQMPGLPTQ
jgi:hypothetical protein